MSSFVTGASLSTGVLPGVAAGGHQRPDYRKYRPGQPASTYRLGKHHHNAFMTKLRTAPPSSHPLLTVGTALFCGGAAAVIYHNRRRARQRRLGAAARGKRVLILGGGFAGRYVATALARQLPADEATAEIILVDENPYLLFTPMLTEAAGGMVDARHIVSPVRELPAGVSFRQGRVEEIDLAARRVTLRPAGPDGGGTSADALPLEADHLVLALGSVANYHGVAGLEEHSVSMKRLGDAEAVHARVLDLLARAEAEPDRAARRQLLTVVVGGAGYTGVETMAAVNELLRVEAGRRQRRGAPLEPGDVTTILVDPVERLMPELKSAGLAAYAEAQLREAGVDVRLQTKITAAGPGFVELDGKERLTVGLLIWSGGEMPHPLVSKLEGVRLSKQGALEVEATGAVPGRPGVWAIGDCAALPRPDGQGTYAPTAQNAVREGVLVAANILASLGGEPMRAFTYRPIGELALVGRSAGVAEVYGWPFSGLLGVGDVAGRVPGQDARPGPACAHPARLVTGCPQRRRPEPRGDKDGRVPDRPGARNFPALTGKAAAAGLKLTLAFDLKPGANTCLHLSTQSCGISSTTWSVQSTTTCWRC